MSSKLYEVIILLLPWKWLIVLLQAGYRIYIGLNLHTNALSVILIMTSSTIKQYQIVHFAEFCCASFFTRTFPISTARVAKGVFLKNLTRGCILSRPPRESIYNCPSPLHSQCQEVDTPSTQHGSEG